MSLRCRSKEWQQEHDRRHIISEIYRQRLRSQFHRRVLRNRIVTSRITLSLKSALLKPKVVKKRVKTLSTMSSVSSASAYTAVQQCDLEDPQLPTAQRLQKQETMESTTSNGRIVTPKIEALLQVIPSQPSRIRELHIDFADYTAIIKSSLSILHCSVTTRFPSPLNPRLHPALHGQYIAGTEGIGYPKRVINFILNVSQSSLSPDLKETHRNVEQYLKTTLSSKITDIIRVVPDTNRPEKVGNTTKSSCKLSKQNTSAKILENASLLVEKTTLQKRSSCLISIENIVKKIKIGQKICNVVQTKKYASQLTINLRKPLSSPLEIDYSILPVFKLRSIENVKTSSSSTSESLALIAGGSEANHFQTFNHNTSSPLLGHIPVYIPTVVGFEKTIFEPYIPTLKKTSNLPQTQLIPSCELPEIVQEPFMMQAMQKVSSVGSKKPSNLPQTQLIPSYELPEVVQEPFMMQAMQKVSSVGSKKPSNLPQTQLIPSYELPEVLQEPFMMQAMQKVSSVVNTNTVPKIPSASPKYKENTLELGQCARTRSFLPKRRPKKTLSDLKSPKSKSPCFNSTLFKNRDTKSSNLSSLSFENITKVAPKRQTISSQMSRKLVIDQTLIPSIETSNPNCFPLQIPANPKYSNTLKSYTREEITFCFDGIELLNLKDEIGRTYNLCDEKVSSYDLYNFPDEEFLETNVQMSDLFP